MRRSQSACRTDPDTRGVAELRSGLVARRENRRQQCRERPVVGVPAGIRLGGDFLRHRHVSRHPNLVARQLSCATQVTEDPLRRV